MDSKKPSKSILIFRSNMEELLGNLIALKHYEILSLQCKRNLNSGLLKDKQKLLEPITSFEKENYLKNSLFVHLISSLEVYLQDRLIEELEKSDQLLHKFILEYKFQRKLTGEDLIKGPQKVAIELIDSIVFHNLKLVNSLYKIVLGFDIIKLMKHDLIWTAIKIRHKIVHRAGLIDDKKIFVAFDGLFKTINAISKWVENIDYFYRTEKIKNNSPNYYKRYLTHMEKLGEEYELDRLLIGLENGDGLGQYTPLNREKFIVIK